MSVPDSPSIRRREPRSYLKTRLAVAAIRVNIGKLRGTNPLAALARSRLRGSFTRSVTTNVRTLSGLPRGKSRIVRKCVARGSFDRVV